jgi:uncharacterized protein (DUF433 family)
MMMATELIHERGRGPELVGTRITVYNLLPHFLDPAVTEADICRIYELTPEQVAAARAYVLCNPETVLAKHLEIEARIAVGNPPGLIEKARETHATFMNFKAWLADRQQAEALEGHTADTRLECDQNGAVRFPTFKEWLAEHESRPTAGP